jgi:hypothetical protein
MSEQIDPREPEAREAGDESGLLLSSEPLAGGGAQFSSVLGDDTKSDTDASDSDGSDLLGDDGSDTDGTDSTDAADTDGTDRAADSDASDDFDVIGIDAPAGTRDQSDSNNLVGGDTDTSDASDTDSSDRR